MLAQTAVILFQKARSSEVLRSLAAGAGERLTVGEILAVLRDRAFALFVLLLGLPNCLPMPPPIPLVCGLLLALVAVQMAAGRTTPWVPRALLRRSIARADIAKAVERALPAVSRLERWSRPRIIALESPVADRVLGFILLAVSIGLLFAAPVIGQIPLGVAVCLIGLGMVERDGVVVLAGVIIGSLGLALSFGFVYAIFAGLEQIF